MSSEKTVTNVQIQSANSNKIMQHLYLEIKIVKLFTKLYDCSKRFYFLMCTHTLYACEHAYRGLRMISSVIQHSLLYAFEKSLSLNPESQAGGPAICISALHSTGLTGTCHHVKFFTWDLNSHPRIYTASNFTH